MAVEEGGAAQQAGFEGRVEAVAVDPAAGRQLGECVDLGVGDVRAGELSGRGGGFLAAVAPHGDDLSPGVYDDGADGPAPRPERLPGELKGEAPGGGDQGACAARDVRLAGRDHGTSGLTSSATNRTNPSGSGSSPVG